MNFNFDATGLGAGPTDQLEESSLPIETFEFNLKTKQDIYENLKLMMEQRHIIYPDNRKLIHPLQQIQYEYSCSGNVRIFHPPRGHDDYCDSLALAAWCFEVLPAGRINHQRIPRHSFVEASIPPA
ncbi:MAG: hypothetical protein ACE5GD_01275 [Candidatus Geothermarchaeales archaeon]